MCERYVLLYFKENYNYIYVFPILMQNKQVYYKRIFKEVFFVRPRFRITYASVCVTTVVVSVVFRRTECKNAIQTTTIK